jgi:hypothetical protein
LGVDTRRQKRGKKKRDGTRDKSEGCRELRLESKETRDKMRPRWEKVSSHKVYERIDQPKWRCTLSIQTYPHRLRCRRKKKLRENKFDRDRRRKRTEIYRRWVSNGRQQSTCRHHKSVCPFRRRQLTVRRWPAGKNNNKKTHIYSTSTGALFLLNIVS